MCVCANMVCVCVTLLSLIYSIYVKFNLISATNALNASLSPCPSITLSLCLTYCGRFDHKNLLVIKFLLCCHTQMETTKCIIHMEFPIVFSFHFQQSITSSWMIMNAIREPFSSFIALYIPSHYRVQFEYLHNIVSSCIYLSHNLLYFRWFSCHIHLMAALWF